MMIEKELFKTGDIVFCRDNTLISKMIRIRTISQWSSCGVIVGRSQGSVKVISANITGIKANTLREWKGKIQVLRLSPTVATDGQVEKMISYLIRLVGKEWTFLEYIKNFSSHEYCTCSGIIHDAMEKSGINIWGGKKAPSYITPGLLYENPNLTFISCLGEF